MNRMLTRLLLSMSLPLALGAGTDDWKTIASKEGGFYILFPEMPTQHKEAAKTPAGAVTVTYYVLEKGGITYVASFTGFPKESVKPRTEEKRLDNARDGAVASAKGKLEQERKFNFRKYPARELLIQGEKGFVRSRIYAVENRLYQTVVMGANQEVAGKDASRFLDSFYLKQ
jgi:hypothetical protein